MKFRLFAVLALFILPLPALAGPREDAMSTAARCSSFSDDRQWLECYYGSAQPMRAALRLPPAAASQISLANSANGAPGASAGPREDVLNGSARCTSYADNRQYLDCYYGAAQPMRARLRLSPVSPAQQSLAAAAYGAVSRVASTGSTFGRHKSSGWFSGIFGSSTDAPVPEAEFGKHDSPRQSAAASEGPTDQVTAQVSSYKFDMLHHFTLKLENGQTWRQVQGDTEDAHLYKAARNYTANITRGWFGSYDLRFEGLHGVYKVDRID